MGIRRFFQRRKEDADLAQELEAHIAHQADENVASGMPPEEARRQAYLRLGNPGRLREDVWQWNTIGFLESMVQDLRYTLRTLRRMPGFAVVALLTLALGSGATTVMFTVINGVLLKPLPYYRPEELVALEEKTEKATMYGDRWAFAYLNFLDCQHESRSLAMAAWRFASGTVSQPGDAEYVEARQISSDFFPILGINLMSGRTFSSHDDSRGAAPVAIISYVL
jgi:hypothetical protein